MKESSAPKKKVIKALEKFEAGEEIVDICMQFNISRQTLYDWRRKYNAREIQLYKEIRQLQSRLRMLHEHNTSLASDLRQVKELFETITVS